MNKRLRILFLLALILPFSEASAQCTPGNYTRPGIYPDSASGFPPAVATYQYNLVVTAVIPVDTLFGVVRVPIDSIGVVSVQGLPAGFTYKTNTHSGYWKGGTKGCLLITGKPTSQQIGKHPLVFEVVGYIVGFQMPYNITYYSITVLDSVAYGIFSPSDQNDLMLSAFPNPFKEALTLQFHSETQANIDLFIYDVHGRLTVSEKVDVTAGDNWHTIDTYALRPGVYLCRLFDSARGMSSVIRLTKY
ncbi:MAG: T9SS type A sorting domain-containing protein [Bacteroidales bacterium]|nr:T9SS type A sorting domain-containing protein [Bacteroidales bacterium]MDZ4204749.1 T9SS type A sorting domain-containing protein [Bacteroidales bacterium]